MYHDHQYTPYEAPSAPHSIFLVDEHVHWHAPRAPLFNCMGKDAPEMYTCDKCGFRVYLNVNLKVHMAFFHSNETGKSLDDFCSFTERRFNLSNILKCYKCDDCNFQTHSLLVLLKHSKKGHPKKKPETEFVAPRLPTSTRYFPTNTRKVAPRFDEWFECEECSFKCKNKYTAMAHIQRKHTVFNESELLKCEHCPFKTPFKGNLKSHARQHVPLEERQWFPCEFCPHKSKQKKHLEVHILAKHTSNENIKWFPCEHCKYKAKSKSTLKGHMTAKHTAPEDISWIHCHLCLYKCKRKSHLKQHLTRKHKIPSEELQL